MKEFMAKYKKMGLTTSLGASGFVASLDLDDGTHVELSDDEFDQSWVIVSATGMERCASLPANAGIVVLDTALTPELEAEGLARDLVRAVQQARREAGLQVSDRITLTLMAGDVVLAAARTHLALIGGETLATHIAVVDTIHDGTKALEFGELVASANSVFVGAGGIGSVDLTDATVGDGLPVKIGIVRATEGGAS